VSALWALLQVPYAALAPERPGPMKRSLPILRATVCHLAFRRWPADLARSARL